MSNTFQNLKNKRGAAPAGELSYSEEAKLLKKEWYFRATRDVLRKENREKRILLDEEAKNRHVENEAEDDEVEEEDEGVNPLLNPYRSPSKQPALQLVEKNSEETEDEEEETQGELEDQPKLMSLQPKASRGANEKIPVSSKQKEVGIDDDDDDAGEGKLLTRGDETPHSCRSCDSEDAGFVTADSF